MKPSLAKPPLDVPAAAAALTDGMIAALLRTEATRPLIAQARKAFVAYCSAHPQFTDVRQAWASFHSELQQMFAADPSSVLSVAFHTAPAVNIPILQTPVTTLT